ncbi:uncharacterized protein LOC126188059 [Schistocerca cancellata]|uniref:uncharacterized protein LOC126188059 n=1 Tax=Schistocerca cancellata TaxID=274614 RepID=UPI00211838B9|nr:uncharacterized protein LOC126188059 [Schistocerca cancellata]
MERIYYIIVALLVYSAVLTEASSLKQRLQQIRDAGCSEPGQIICTDNCSKVSVCLGDGSSGTDGFTTMPVEICSSGTRCSASNMTCVAPSQSDCHTLDSGFTCHATGYLPDPYNCTVYHLCLDVNRPPFLTGSCTGGWAYDPLTTDCSLTQLDRVCTEGPVPACETVGQNGAIPENKHIYYVCVNTGGHLRPILYKCEHGQIWSDTSDECIDNALFKEN